MKSQTKMNLTEAHWQNGPEVCELSAGQVHVWRASFMERESDRGQLWSLLSEKETTRASALHFPEDSDLYVFSHGVLRDILARYRALVKHPLGIGTGSKGEPYLLQANGPPKLKFSLSHSRALALLAVTLDRGIGIDVEDVSQTLNWQAVANHYFSNLEWSEILAANEHEESQAFLSIWTLKEAYVKALGEGLSKPLSSFRILPSPDGTLELIDSNDAAATPTWTFLRVYPDDRHLGALAIEGSMPQVSYWDWSGWSEPRASTQRL